TSLGHDETLLVQSGKPVGIFHTHPGAPRVLIVNSLLVPAWATWENFRDLEHKGLTMFGQMTAGSWIYIGSQGIVQGTYETRGAARARAQGWAARGVGRSVRLRAHAAGVRPALAARHFTPDVLTDQTSAHDALHGYVPNGLTLGRATRLRDQDPSEYVARSMT